MTEPYDFYHYLPVNDEAMRWGLYITGAGRGTLSGDPNSHPAGHPCLYDFDWNRGRTLPEFQILLITQGKGQFESKDCAMTTIQPNSLIFLFPGVWHRYKQDPETGWHERWLSVNGEICHRLLDQQLICPNTPVLHLEEPDHLASLFDDILNRIHSNPLEQSILLSLRVMSLFAEAVELSQNNIQNMPAQPKPDKKMDPLVAQALELIWTHSHRRLSVDQIIKQLPTTRRTLERHFKQHRGHSILEEVNACRISRAKRLLKETDLPVKTVAYLAGFTHPERLRVMFIQHVGQSPTLYRKS